jgi:hypothetical protein
MLVGVAEGDEILMSACTAVNKHGYRVVTSKGNLYMPFKDLRKPRLKKPLLEWLAKKGMSHLQIEEYNQCDNLNGALWQLKKTIGRWYRLTGCDIIQFWLGPTDGSNFRFKSAVTLPYKGHRKEKPAIWGAVRDYLINVYGAQVIYGYECDDALGIYGEKNPNPDWSSVVCLSDDQKILIHKDKDIFMVPGWHFNTQTELMEYVDRFGSLWLNDSGNLKGRGIAFFYAQLLMGDATDNIPSLKKGKYGDKTAYKLLAGLQTEEQLLAVVVQEYKNVIGGGWKDRLLEQADLTFIVQERGYHGSNYIEDKLNESSII